MMSRINFSGLHRNILALAFCFAIFMGLVLQIIHIVNSVDTNLKGESNVHLAALTAKNFWKYPAIFDEYFRIKFPLRNDYLNFLNDLRFRVFTKSTTNKVVLGKDGWMFNGDENIPIYQGLAKFSGTDLFVIKKYYEAKAKIAESWGGKYFFFLIPNKETIYPEFYADKFPKVDPENRYDQLLRYLERQQSKLNIVHPKHELISAKSLNLPLFFKNDSHWNDIGAFIAYQALAKSLLSINPNLKILSYDEFELSENSSPNGFARMLGLSTPPTEKGIGLTFKNADSSRTYYEIKKGGAIEQEEVGLYKNLEILQNKCVKEDSCKESELIPKIMVYRDSFTSRIKQFLIHNTKELILVKRPFNQDIDINIAFKIKPDVLIDQYLERRLYIPNKFDYHRIVRQIPKR